MSNPMNDLHFMDGSGGERWNIGLMDGLKSV